eukprot:CCRYP_001095-RC/>CCRYP_001095-RC protein AED:0.45 eAED:1.00 QI:0/0/0/1/0/0/2/0/111
MSVFRPHLSIISNATCSNKMIHFRFNLLVISKPTQFLNDKPRLGRISIPSQQPPWTLKQKRRQSQLQQCHYSCQRKHISPLIGIGKQKANEVDKENPNDQSELSHGSNHPS